MFPTFHHSHLIVAFFAIASLINIGGSVCAEDAANARALELFEKHVRPTLVDACIRCHGPDKQKGGLRLDSASWVRKGGDSGEVIDVDDPAESILLQAIAYDDPALEMPPKGKLADETIAAFQQWVAAGAVDPRGDSRSGVSDEPTSPTVQEGKSFWSFQPIQHPTPPTVEDETWPLTEIDRFVLAKLEANEITPTTDANRTTLLRRVYYDLVGLPPTPQQIQDFVNDESTDAYEKLIDRLLNSPQFGERWGRHWLDVVRFAQSSGGGRTLLFPDAWRYRDYVINAFNDDMRYDQFLREQIAGDLLPFDDWQQRRRQLIATAFLLLGPTNYEKQDKDELEMDVVDEQLDTLGKAMLGMTIGCARCHDHKFDPIPTEDYYALAGILRSTKAMIHSNVSTWNQLPLPESPEIEAEILRHEQAIAELEERVSATKKRLKKLGAEVKDEKKSSPKSIPSVSLEGIVIDNVDSEIVGEWIPSTSAASYVNEEYLHDGTADKGKKRVVFLPKLDAPGIYEVRVSYSPGKNRSSKVPIHVHHARGVDTRTIDQKKTPELNDVFTSLGVFALDDKSEVIVSTEGTEDGVVIADALQLIPSKLVPLPTADQVDLSENIKYIVQDPRKLRGIVVDDVDAKLEGEWEHSVHTPPFVGGSYIHDKNESKGNKSATFVPSLPRDGLYEVRVSHNTNVRCASDVPITIRHADGTSEVRIDEATAAPIDHLFRSIGTFRFEKGREGSVRFETHGTDGKYVIVDAVQFIPLDRDGESPMSAVEELQRELKSLETTLKTLESSGPQRHFIMATEDDEDAGDIPIAIRGVVHNPGEITPRGLMQVAAIHPRPQIAEGESGRRELADWIASTENPLTARVMVNRIWHWLFGRGIVESVDNFGSMGSLPTHPELLDHLASSFVANGWSAKQLIRQIMLLRVYRLSTDESPSGADKDPGNRLIWRMNRKRLDAEQIRDTLLFVSGSLDQTAGGPNLLAGTKSEYGYTFESTRRSVYEPVFRNTLPEIFEVFDFADPNIQQGSRTSSTIASQALLLMNHPQVIQQSRRLAERMLASGSSSVSSRVANAYLELLGRPPSAEEASIAIEFLGDLTDDGEADQRWAMLYQALVQCVDFRFVD